MHNRFLAEKSNLLKSPTTCVLFFHFFFLIGERKRQIPCLGLEVYGKKKRKNGNIYNKLTKVGIVWY